MENLTHKIYGELNSEKLANDSTISRRIVKEINDFGINDRQRWMIIYNLSLELENVEEMKMITSFIRENMGDKIFISKIYGGEDQE